MDDPELRNHTEELGSEVMTTTPEGFSALIKCDYARWERVVWKAGIGIEE